MSTVEDATQPPSWWDDRDDAAAAAIDPAPPVIDPACYRVLGEHGRGGLGRVLRAQDLRTGRVVAVTTYWAEGNVSRSCSITESLPTPDGPEMMKMRGVLASRILSISASPSAKMVSSLAS